MKIREHPVTLFRQFVKISVPLFAVILRRNSPETAVALTLSLLYLFLSFVRRTVNISRDELLLSKGVLFLRRKIIKREMITGISKSSFLGICKVSFILGGRLKETVYLTSKNYNKTANSLFESVFSSVKRSSSSSVLKASFFLANAFGGVLTAAAFFVGIYKAVGAVFYKSLASLLFEIGEKLRLFELPFYIILSTVALLSLVISVVSSSVKYQGFTEREGGDERRINFGLILKYEYILKKSSELCKCRAHTILSRLFDEIFHMKMSEGLGKKENFYPLTVYSEKRRESLCPITPRKRSYLYKPLLFLAVLILLWRKIPKFLLFILLFLALRYFVNSLYASVYSSVSVCGSGVLLKTGKGAVFYEVFLPFEKVASLNTRILSFLKNGSVNLTFILKGNDGQRFKIKHLSNGAAKEILEKIKNYVAK